MTGFSHIGVRGSASKQDRSAASSRRDVQASGSGIWHYARPCGHKINSPSVSPTVKYNGGPLWRAGYTWQNIFWGSYFATPSAAAWVQRIEKAVLNIETDENYSAELTEYNVGMGRVIPPAFIKTVPSTRLTDSQIKQALVGWISQGTVSNLGSHGAFNIFLPPGTTVSLSPLEASCKSFCDYHNTVNGTNGPFYTVEPYPCASGCNQCTTDSFDTLTQGLSEEMVELKTDMDPGTGWVIGNEELCDYCDAKFVCNRISTGEYVNAWYDKTKKACWIGSGSQNREPFIAGIEPGRTRVGTSQ
ncbi:MAG TPA: hypothetical protein VFJ63_01710 [Candidatus Bathyarchaeia archaeon]|nr:hypothetical protein [Candidatus Bathyarchaeia archaeon]